MTLRFDPLQVFRTSRTPAGLYARQKWLNAQDEPCWTADFQVTVGSLLAGQSADGSWGHSVLMTVQRLFGLHLTVRNPNEPIMRALDWLTDKTCQPLTDSQTENSGFIASAALQGVPFSPCRWRYFVKGAVLFLASIFGREKDERIVSLYEALSLEGERTGGRWCGWSCSNNILRAFVVNPTYAECRATALAVEALARVQSSSGRWPIQVPFYQTLNALAHLDSAAAEAQLARAFERLREAQHKDGTWGRSQREWNTFLVVHALKNKGAFTVG